MSGQAFVQFIGFFAANIAVASLISYIIDSRTAAWQPGNRSESSTAEPGRTVCL